MEHARPGAVAPAYSEDSPWRTRSEFFAGRDAIVEFLHRKWQRELDYPLIKEAWAFTGHRMRCASSTRATTLRPVVPRPRQRAVGVRRRGPMRRREASINDVPIDEADRRIRGPRPESEHGASLPLA